MPKVNPIRVVGWDGLTLEQQDQYLADNSEAAGANYLIVETGGEVFIFSDMMEMEQGIFDLRDAFQKQKANAYLEGQKVYEKLFKRIRK